MTRPLAQPVEQEQAALQNLIVALAYAQGMETVTEALLAFPGITPAGVRLLATIPQIRGLVRLGPPPGAHAAVQAVNRQNLMRRAAYLTAASRRLSTAAGMGSEAQARAVVVERRWLLQHLQATAQREVVASHIGAVARRQQREAKRDGTSWNGLLGWYATVDAVTSPECRRANGRNFDPTAVPPIGFPGSVHAMCRCLPGPPHATSLRVERLVSDRESGHRAGAKRATMGA